MSELLPCPFCGNPAQYFRDDRAQSVNCFECNLSMDFNHFPTFEDAQKKLFELWNTRYSKYPLAPVSSTLDRLLDSRFDTNRQELLDRSIDIVDEMEVGSFTEEMAQELRDTLTMCITPEAEADLGEIEHKGEKVMVKIKVVRGE